MNNAVRKQIENPKTCSIVAKVIKTVSGSRIIFVLETVLITNVNKVLNAAPFGSSWFRPIIKDFGIEKSCLNRLPRDTLSDLKIWNQLPIPNINTDSNKNSSQNNTKKRKNYFVSDFNFFSHLRNPLSVLIQTRAVLTVDRNIAVVFQQICYFFAYNPAVTSRKNHILHRISCVISGKYTQCKTSHPERLITAVRIKNFE